MKRLVQISRALTAAFVIAMLSGCGSGTSLDAATPPSDAPTLTWKPTASDTWQWQLHKTVNTSYDVAVYDIDLFDTPETTLSSLHRRGIHVVCYFSAGSSEDFRDDFSSFREADMGKPLKGWEGERWLDIRSANVKQIMQHRLDLAKQKGCDGVEPDNVDGYANKSGFPLTAEDQLAYNRFLSEQAHQRRLAVGLKNDTDQIAELEPVFDFAVNEQCHEMDECDTLAPFSAKGKTIFNAEYAKKYLGENFSARKVLCTDAHTLKMHTLVLPLELDDSFRFSCD